MDIQVAVTGTGLEDERIAEATRQLLKDIRADADPRARLVTMPPEPGGKRASRRAQSNVRQAGRIGAATTPSERQ